MEHTAMRLRAAARTDIGRVRDLNEDAFASHVDRGVFVVCDGMGGAPAGEVASQLAVDAIMAAMDGKAAARGDAADGYLPQTVQLADAVRQSNAFIYSQGRRDPRHTNMGTTVVSAWVADHVVSVAHVGDSRAYLWHDGRLEPLTRDHSLIEEQIRAGLIDREAARESPNQNILLRVVGREPHVDVDVSEVPVRAGDYLVLCSDGLSRAVPDAVIAGAIVQLRDPGRICDYLIDAANRNGGADNITVLVVEVIGSWWQRLWRGARRQVRGEGNGTAHSAV